MDMDGGHHLNPWEFHGTLPALAQPAPYTGCPQPLQADQAQLEPYSAPNLLTCHLPESVTYTLSEAFSD